MMTAHFRRGLSDSDKSPQSPLADSHITWARDVGMGLLYAPHVVGIWADMVQGSHKLAAHPFVGQPSCKPV